MVFRLLRLSLALFLATLISGCGGNAVKERFDYREVESVPTLDVPPDLTRPSETDLLPIPDLGDKLAARQLLPATSGARIVKAGAQRWLEVDATADAIWQRLPKFFNGLGLKIGKADPGLGIMETEWAVNLADVEHGAVTDFVRRWFPHAYDPGSRDLYRVRLERGDDGTSTEVYISHYGMAEHVLEGGGESAVTTRWVPRPSDPELVNILYARLLVDLGMTEQAAQQTVTAPQEAPARVRLLQIDGTPALELDDGFDRAWRRLGNALDQIGLAVTDRDRSRGLYFVIDRQGVVGRPGEEKGGFLGMFTSDAPTETAFTVTVQPHSEPARVTVQGGEPSLTGEQQQRVLERLLETLR